MVDLESFNKSGYTIIRNALDSDFVEKAREQLIEAIRLESEYHKSKDYPDYGMVLNCALYQGAFFELFEHDRIVGPVNEILGNGSIIYAYTSSSMPPLGTNYSHRVHVDSPRIIPGYITNVGMTIALDDFTEDNGATYFLPGSHTQENCPDEDYFYENAKRLIINAGDMWVFNARTWHSGGQNKTASWRHALTVNFVRPWMKQRIDIPKSLKNIETGHLSDQVKQKLGFYAQVPENYEEYYAPREKRKYRQHAE